MTQQLLSRINKTIQNPQIQFDSWSKNFLTSISQQFASRGKLSPKQIESFEKIEKKYSDTDRDPVWEKEYFETKRCDALEVAAWLNAQAEARRSPFYHQNTALNVLNNPNFLPSKEAYAAMVENKFAQRFLKLRKETPKFKPGDFVCYGSRIKYDKRNFLVVSVVAAFQMKLSENFTAGCHLYTLLPFGETRTWTAQERYIKKSKLKRKF